MKRTRRVLLAAAVAAVGAAGTVVGGNAAQASSCDPDWVCVIFDPPKPGKVQTGTECGYVWVRSGEIYTEAHVLPCPGPVIF